MGEGGGENELWADVANVTGLILASVGCNVKQLGVLLHLPPTSILLLVYIYTIG